MTRATVMGNYVVLKLANGDYACYAHFLPGSLRVKTGDQVKKGDVLGRVGNSGNSDGPHLHFQVVKATGTGELALKGEGVPFLLDAFDVVMHDPESVQNKVTLSTMGKHAHELPAEGDVVRY